MVKRILSFLILIAVIASAFVSFSACGKFLGGIKAFSSDGDFYTNVGNVLYSIIAGPNSYIPFAKNGDFGVNASFRLSDYKKDGEIVKDGNAIYEASIKRNGAYDFDSETRVSAFGLDVYKREITQNGAMYLEYGDSINMPLVYKGDADNYIKRFADMIGSAFADAKYVDGKENYSLNGVNFKTDTVEVCLNSTVINDLFESYSMFLIEATNLVYNEMHYSFNDIWYFVDGENIHLTWKRYFDGDELCREYIKLHDNNNHYVAIDIAYAKDNKQEYVELSLKANDGTSVFDILSASVNKKNNKKDFTTTANIMIGDEILIIATNCGDDAKAEGSAEIRLVDSLGEMKFPITYNYTGKREGENNDGIGLKQHISIKVDNIYVSFNAELAVSATDVVALESQAPEKYYDLASIEDIYYYHSVAELDYKNRLNAVLSYIKGETPDYVKPGTAVEPFTLEVVFDDGTVYETDGAFGERYVELLTSDNYTYKYTYKTDEIGYPTNYATECRLGDKRIYAYNYSNGEKYEEVHENTTRFEIRHDIETIIYTQYGDDAYKRAYPEPVYIYYQSGKCIYDNRELVYERYYDYSNNKYTFMFDEDGAPEIMIIESVVDNTVLYTFIEELSDVVDESVFILPGYKQIDVKDFYQ